jgi:hypothetical protein
MNDVTRQSLWPYAAPAAVGIWIVLMLRLMIADVWDETNGMLYFSDPSNSLGEIIQFVLTQSLGFWRPLPTLLAGVVMHFVPDFDWSWRVLRAVNMALLIGAIAVLASAIRRFQDQENQKSEIRNQNGARPASSGFWFLVSGFSSSDFCFLISALFSASAVITAGWYANIFDASALFALACGLALLARGRALAAGVVFGVAFFCKETAALILPFLVVLLAARRISWRNALRAGIPAIALGIVYFAMRSRIIAFGGAGDVHTFDAQYLWPSIVRLTQTFWLQTAKDGPWLMIGAAFTLFALAVLRRPLLIAATMAFLGATVVIYWGMLAVVQTDLIDATNFIGRLYLVPVTLFLFLLAMERKTIAMAVLLVPIVFGAALTYRDHARFQRMYKRIYRTAREAKSKPLTVHYPAKPLDDKVRGIRIGEIPNANVRVDAKTGRLIFGVRRP